MPKDNEIKIESEKNYVRGSVTGANKMKPTGQKSEPKPVRKEDKTSRKDK